MNLGHELALSAKANPHPPSSSSSNALRKTKYRGQRGGHLSDVEERDTDDEHSHSPSASPIGRQYTQAMAKLVPRISAKDVDSMEITKQIKSFRESQAPSDDEPSPREHD